ncbi:MAG: hypothetical protein AMXMBFR64_45730 [Myxococcales bacterium]
MFAHSVISAGSGIAQAGLGESYATSVPEAIRAHGAMQAAKIQGAGSMVAGGLTAGGMYLGSIIPGLGTTAGGAIGSVLGNIAISIANLFGKEKEHIANVAASAFSQRIQLAQRKAGIERQTTLASHMGFGVDLATAAKYGFGPEEAAAQGLAYAQAVGHRGRKANIYALLRTGASMGAIAGYEGLRARGAGGRGGSVTTVLGLAKSQGLYGSKADEFVSTLTGAAQTLGQQGITSDMGRYETALASMAASPGLSEAGLRLPRYVAGLAGVAGGARKQLTSGFAGYAEAKVLAHALAQGKSLKGAMKVIDTMDPLAINKAIGGGIAAEMAYADMGAPISEAEALAKGLSAVSPPDGVAGMYARTPKLAAQQAGYDAARINGMTHDNASEALRLQNMMVTKLDEIGATLSEGWIKGLLTKMDEIADEIRGMTNP